MVDANKQLLAELRALAEEKGKANNDNKSQPMFVRKRKIEWADMRRCFLTQPEIFVIPKR
jgi:hypothetical protein